MADDPSAHDLSVELSRQAASLAAWLAATDGPGEAATAVAEIAGTLRRLGDALGVDVNALATRHTDPVAAPPSGPTPAPPVEVTVPVLGVDACSAGWVGAILEPGAPRPRIAVAATIAALVEMVRQTLDLQAVAIDIPIGLPDDSTRQADVLARKALKGKASSVFFAAISGAPAMTAKLSSGCTSKTATVGRLRTQASTSRILSRNPKAWAPTP